MAWWSQASEPSMLGRGAQNHRTGLRNDEFGAGDSDFRRPDIRTTGCAPERLGIGVHDAVGAFYSRLVEVQNAATECGEPLIESFDGRDRVGCLPNWRAFRSSSWQRGENAISHYVPPTNFGKFDRRVSARLETRSNPTSSDGEPPMPSATSSIPFAKSPDLFRQTRIRSKEWVL